MKVLLMGRSSSFVGIFLCQMLSFPLSYKSVQRFGIHFYITVAAAVQICKRPIDIVIWVFRPFNVSPTPILLIICPVLLHLTLSSVIYTLFLVYYMMAIFPKFKDGFLSHLGGSLLHQLYRLLFRHKRSTKSEG